MRLRRFDPVVVGGVLVAALTAAIIPLVIAAASGNLSIPHNDAWAYSRIAEVFWSTGRVELVGWNRSPLVGQLLLLAPLGFSVTAQQAGVAALALGTVILTYVLARRYIGDRRGALVAVTVALWPGLALLATSYMTDVPSAFGCVACLAIGDRALREERQGRARLLLVAATLVGLWAVSVRTQTLAAPVAILIAAWCDRAARRRIGSPLIATALVASAAVAAAVIAWHDQQPRADAPDGALTAQTLASIATSGLQWAFTVGLALSPVVVAVARPALWRPSAWVVAATAGAAGAGWAVAVGTDRFFLGNYLSPSGAYAAVALGDRHAGPAALWVAIVVAAVISTALAAGHLWDARPRGVLLPVSFAALTLLGDLASAGLGQTIFDRYALAVAPAVAIVLLAPRRAAAPPHPSRTRAAARFAMLATALLGLAGISTLLALNAWSFDVARWRLAERIAAEGVDPARIDAGLEWLGWHSAAGVVDRHPTAGRGFEPYFSDRPSCVRLEAGDGVPSDGRVIARIHYPTYLLFGSGTISVVRTDAPGC